MEIHDSVSSIIANKELKEIWKIGPDDKVFDAIHLMSEKNVGALPVMDGEELVGMFSERDYTRKVILLGRSSRETAVREIMTTPAVYVPPSAKVTASMQLMTEKRIRHLPVVEEGGKLIGIVSIGDLVRRTISAQEALIDQLEGYVTACYPG